MPEAANPAVGIDLGTTFSVIAHLDSTGRPWSIPNGDGDITTPSVVFFDTDLTIVGKEASKAGAMEPERVAQFVKRDMGASIYSKPINGEHLPPEVIQSLILEKLKQDAERKLGPFTKVVITVPAYFNEPRRKATMDAGQLAGLDVLDIINEPTAAAITFGVQQGFLTGKGESLQKEKILVYDLGGGTFDVTLMEIDGKNYRAVATAGDVQLGGIDWDRRIVDFLAEEFKAKHRGLDPRENSTGLQRLLREGEEAKRTLSFRETVTIAFDYSGLGIRVPLTRTRFQQMTVDLLDRTRFTTTKLLQEAGVKWADMTRILLVGGSTRMPAVREMLERESGMKVDQSLATDEAVAHGAAIYAGILLSADATSGSAMKVQNVNSHDLGVLGTEPATGRPRKVVVIPKNTTLPARDTKRFKTIQDDQRTVVVRIIEGGDASGNNATAIGQCVVPDLPPSLPAGTAVDVTFSYAQNGQLTVHAGLPGVNRDATLEIDRASGMTKDSLRQWNLRLRSNRGPLSLQ